MTEKAEPPAYLNAAADSLPDDTAVLQQVLDAYDRAWTDLDVPAILAHYHYPCMVLTQEGVGVSNDEKELRPSIAGAVDAMRTSAYARSEIAEVSCKQLSESVALVSQRVVRFDATGTAIGEGVTTYTLTKTDGGWKIAVLMPHHPEAMPRYR